MLTPLLLAVVGLALFVAPHRGRNAPAAKRTLYGMTGDLLRFAGGGSRHTFGIVLFGSACLSVFAPAVLLAVVRLCPPGAARFLLGVGALVILAAAAATYLLLALSRSTFGFGPGQIKDATIVAKLIPTFLVGCAAMALLGAASAGWAEWLRAI